MASQHRPIFQSLPAILVIVEVICWIVFKWGDLSIALFWDEVGVYGPGIMHMIDHVPGILPKHLPPELSRGHPLLFYFLFACYGWVFEPTIFNFRLLALGITVLMFAGVYLITRRRLNSWYAWGATTVLLAMPNLFAMGSLVLPEILLAICVLQALDAFHAFRMREYFIMASLALLIKESAMVLPISTLCFVLLSLPHRKWRYALLALAPILSYVLFLIVQKFQNGWFLFPYHVSLIESNPYEVWNKFIDFSEFLFLFQGRYVWALLGFSGIFYWGMYSWKYKNIDFITLLLVFSGGMLLFSSLYAYMNRYITLLFPILSVATFHSFSLILSHKRITSDWIIGIIVLALAVPPFFHFSQSDFHYDQDNNYQQLVQVQVEASHFLETEIDHATPILTNFPLYSGCTDQRFGFLQQKGSVPVTVFANDTLKYAAVITPGTPPSPIIQKRGQLIWTFEQGYAKVQIYALSR